MVAVSIHDVAEDRFSRIATRTSASCRARSTIATRLPRCSILSQSLLAKLFRPWAPRSERVLRNLTAPIFAHWTLDHRWLRISTQPWDRTPRCGPYDPSRGPRRRRRTPDRDPADLPLTCLGD